MSDPTKKVKPIRTPDDFTKIRNELLKQLHDAISKKDRGKAKQIRGLLQGDDLVP